MKIGILTVHSQINYGAILQTMALQHVLSTMGYDVVILDRQLDKDLPGALLGALAKFDLKCWTKLIARGLLMLGDFCDLIRRVRTECFIKRHLRLSSFKFINLEDIPSGLRIDMILVGSDQIWNTRCHDPHVFLLDAPFMIPAVAYAASFGMDAIDMEWKELFKRQLPRFSAVSARERQGVGILSQFGIRAQRVLDPTLLPDHSAWEPLVKRRLTEKKTLVCYFTEMPPLEELRNIYYFAKNQKCRVEIYVGNVPMRFPPTLAAFCNVVGEKILSLRRGVRHRFCATPREFVSSIANAQWVVTSAFHGLMFACVFKKEVRLVKSFHGTNSGGFRRMEEFVDDFMSGQVIFTTIGGALSSLNSGNISYDDEKLLAARDLSLKWLTSSLNLAISLASNQ